MERKNALLDRKDPLNELVGKIPWNDYGFPMDDSIAGLLTLTRDIDVIVELTSQDDLLEKMVELAVQKKNPLICRHPEAEVSEHMLKCLYSASEQIPIFWASYFDSASELLRFAMIMVEKPVMEEDRFYNSENIWDEYCERFESEKS